MAIRYKQARWLVAHYRCCPIKPGEKRPLGQDWPNRPLTVEKLDGYPVDGAGVGIMTGKRAPGSKATVYAIDVDFPGDAETCAAMRAAIADRFGLDDDMVYRVGFEPKFLVPVCMPIEGLDKKVTPWYAKNGVQGRVEFLADGQQFVALGIHPGTGQEYKWFGSPLCGETEDQILDEPDFLPQLRTEVEVVDLLRQLEKAAVEHGWEPVAGTKTVPGTPAYQTAGIDELSPQRPLGVKPEEAWEWIKDHPGHENREEWLRIGMALKFEFGGTEYEEAAIQLWDKWSQGASNYRGIDDIRGTWSTIHKTAQGRLSVTLSGLRWAYRKAHYDKTAELTESGRAARFAEHYAGMLRYTIDTAEWYLWDSLRWRRLTSAEVLPYVRYILDDDLRQMIADMESGNADKEALESAQRFYKAVQKGGAADRVLHIATGYESLWARSGDFNAQVRYLGVKNGVIDLDTLQAVTPRRDMFVSMCAGTDYDPSATCPVWEAALDAIFSGDKELIDFLQRLMGYSLLGKPVEEVMGIFSGKGANGKSMLLNIFRLVHGEYAHTVSADMFTTVGAVRNTAGAARADLMALRGKRFVMASEVDQRARLQESVVKSLVSTDEISARNLYQSTVVNFKPTWLMVLATNYDPTVEGTDDGVWRRLLSIPFMRQFLGEDRDITLADRLRQELPGILNWLLEGVRKYRKYGLKKPKAIEEACKAYRRESDVLLEWLETRCTVKAGLTTTTDAAWQSWRAFMDGNGIVHAINTKNRLSRALKARGFESKPSYQSDGRVVRCYLGFSIADMEVL